MTIKLGKLELFLNNDWEQRLQVVNLDGTYPDISAYGIIFTVGDEYEEGSPIIQKKNANVSGGSGTQINMQSAANGYYKLIIDDTDQSGLNIGSDSYKDYIYDIKFVIGGEYFTQIVNTFRIKNVVNRVNP